jgi:NADH-quinone oxidoreductase subunit D
MSDPILNTPEQTNSATPSETRDYSRYSVMHDAVSDVEYLPEGLMRLNLGPSHPATHGILQNIMDIDGETIVRTRPVIGYVHRTFEKLGEKYTYNQFLNCTDRMNYISPPMNNVAWTTVAEEILQIKAPPRAQVIRTIINELSRIADHIICNGILGVDVGGYTGFLYVYHFREQVYNIMEKMVGARLTTTFTRLGGLEMDMYPDFVKDVKQFLNDYPKILKDFNTLLIHNRIFIDRCKGVGAISAKDALAWGYTGPNLRAAGVPLDLRKDSPYLVYDQVDFDIPVGVDGSVYDRFLVRIEEMEQSMRIIRQCVDNIPEGAWAIDDYHITMPPKEKVYTSMEELIYHFKLVMNGIKVPAGEYYSAVEAANGELGFYVVSDGTEKPYRVHVRRPCFWYYQSFPELVEGGFISDAVAIMSSLNVIAGELDG